MELFQNHLDRQGDNVATTQMSGTLGDMPVGAPEVYGGSPDVMNPEEMLLASINSCLMLVFYHFADRHRVWISSYHAVAEGKVDKTKDGLRFTEVRVKADIVPVDSEQASAIDDVAHLAEKYCLVSNALSCPVHYEVRVINPTVVPQDEHYK